MWRSNYDMKPGEFALLTDTLWADVSRSTTSCNCYTRRKLNEKYGDAVQPPVGPIRADLLGNMWAQQWTDLRHRRARRRLATSATTSPAAGEDGYDAGEDA